MSVCGVVCNCGPSGEPLACGFAPHEDGPHSWASLPTWTERWTIFHTPPRLSKDRKRVLAEGSMSIQGPPTEGAQVVFGVAMERGVPAFERADGSPEHSTEDEQWAVQAMQGVRLIAAERERQVAEEGWTADHDDTHDVGELGMAAAAYAFPCVYLTAVESRVLLWPWSEDSFKPASHNVMAVGEPRIRELVKAGALIAAEIDRLQRAGHSTEPER